MTSRGQDGSEGRSATTRHVLQAKVTTNKDVASDSEQGMNEPEHLLTSKVWSTALWV